MIAAIHLTDHKDIYINIVISDNIKYKKCVFDDTCPVKSWSHRAATSCDG